LKFIFEIFENDGISVSALILAMPVPTPQAIDYPMFPLLSREQIDATRTSSWYETFVEITPKATFIDLDQLGEKTAFLDVRATPLPAARRRQLTWVVVA